MSLNDPFFSVIIPLYNKEAYVKDTIESILAQSFQYFEVIIVNDGSTDSSLSVVKNFEDSRIRVYSTENKGAAAARNYGVEQATCNYIAFLDADDTWNRDFLIRMRDLIERYPNAGLYLSSHYIYNKTTSHQISSKLTEGIIDNFFKAELDYHIIRLSATVVPIKVFKSVSGFPDGMISGEDSYFFAKVASNHSIAYTHVPLVNYNKKFTGISLRYGKMDNCKESWFDLLDENNFYKNEFIADKALKAGIRYAIGNHLFNSRQVEKQTKYTVMFKKQWLILYTFNRLPASAITLFTKLKPIYSKIKSMV